STVRPVSADFTLSGFPVSASRPLTPSAAVAPGTKTPGVPASAKRAREARPDSSRWADLHSGAPTPPFDSRGNLQSKGGALGSDSNSSQTGPAGETRLSISLGVPRATGGS